MTFQPEGDLPRLSSSHELRHGTLPSEHVCTENLTPFLKLLPCKSLSGIAHLLNPHRLFDADWHGMGVHVRYLEDAGVEVRLAFQAVLNPVRYSSDRKRGTITPCIPATIDCNLIFIPRLVSPFAVRSNHREVLSCCKQ